MAPRNTRGLWLVAALVVTSVFLATALSDADGQLDDLEDLEDADVSVGRRGVSSGRGLVRRMKTSRGGGRGGGGFGTWGRFGFQGNHEEMLGESADTECGRKEHVTLSGSAKWSEKTPPQCAADSEIHAVRCCSQDGTTGTSPGCKKKTYAEAEAWCKKNNQRLCATRDELQTAQGTGCRFDDMSCWISQQDLVKATPKARQVSREDIPFSLTSFDEDPSARKTNVDRPHSDCKTQIKKKGGGDSDWCTSCNDGKILRARNAWSRAGRCIDWEHYPVVSCDALDWNEPDVSPLTQSTLCFKRGIVAENLNVKKLTYSSANRTEGFSWAQSEKKGYEGWAVVRCKAAKWTACRGSSCVVKKSMKCHSVCPHAGKHWTASETPDCRNHRDGKGRALCEAEYTDAQGQKRSFGDLACHQVAMSF